MSNIKAKFGVGLRYEHYGNFSSLEEEIDVSWLEVHSENFFDNGRPKSFLCRLRKKFDISLHGVGASLGSFSKPCPKYLHNLKILVDLIDPIYVSDHVSWSEFEGKYSGDLLPLPYMKESEDILSRNIDIIQNYLQREILIENPSSYVSFKQDQIPEWEFINNVVERTGCSILLDVNNIYVSAFNHKFNAFEYIDNINLSKIKEIHLAGHSKTKINGKDVIIDTHSNFVCGEVWELYKYLILKTGSIDTLIEWDSDLPEFSDLIGEASKAKEIMNELL